MEDIHRELLKKRQRYVLDNVIFEEGLIHAFKEKGLFTATMIHSIQTEKDPERQMGKILDMVTKRGPDAYTKFLECLETDYHWVVENFREKEEELLNTKGLPDVVPEVRRTVKEYVKELARTTRINIAQSKAIEDFLCRHICIDTNLSNAKSHGNRLFGIHRQLISAIPLSSLDESDQMELNDILPENVTVERIEKEVSYLVDRVNDLQSTLDNCYEKLGENSKEKELPDLIYALRKMALEKEIRIEEIKNQMINTARQVRLAKEKARKAQEASVKTEEEKEDLTKSLDTLKVKIQKLQEERQRMGMKMAFESTMASTTAAHTPPSTHVPPSAHTHPSGHVQPLGNDSRTAPSSPTTRTKSSRSWHSMKVISSRDRQQQTYKKSPRVHKEKTT